MRAKAIVVAVVLSLVLVALAGSVALAGQKAVCDNNTYVKHMQMGGGDAYRCMECHSSKKDAMPGELKGKYANMGGPNHGCLDCHYEGGKAVPLPLPWGAISCAGDPAMGLTCHPSK